ncbi:MAG: hypothetical protein QOE86_2492 [Solirubrobacteraceae bacterium]|nr:hypothetical protein [Solirubrobacteraceae bacterium]
MLSAMLRASPVATAIVDGEGTVTALNEAAALLFGVGAGDRLRTSGLAVDVIPYEGGAIVVALLPRPGIGAAAVIDQSTDAVIVTDAVGRIVEWNPMATLLIGGTAEQVRGRPIDALVVEHGLGAEVRSALDRARGGQIARYEARRETPDGEPVDLSVVLSPLREGDGSLAGVVVVARDITALRSAERARDRAAARARFLARASRLLAGSLELDQTLGTVGALLVPDWADVSVIGLRDGTGRLEALMTEHADPALSGAVRRLFVEHATTPRPGGMIDRALTTGRTVLAPDYRDPRVRIDDPVRAALHALGARSLLVAPLRIRGSVLGILIAAMTVRSDRRFDAEDADLVQDVADRAAQAIDNARSYHAARAAEERFRAAFEDAPIGVALLHVDPEGATRFAEVNPALCHIYGADRDGLVGRAADDLGVGEQRLVRDDGEERWVHVQSAPLTGGRAGPHPVAYVAQIQDVTERRRFERELEHLASHDPLTGVLNRRRFEEELERALAGVRRHRRPAALVTLDLDNFKHVNDTYGNPAGDDLLRAVALALRERVRATDAVGRLGGDEFGIVLAGTGEVEAEEVAKGLLEAFRSRVGVEVGERIVRVTASAGVRQLAPEGTMSATELLGEADMALYEAKERGRDRLAVAGQIHDVPRVVHHGRWRERIRDALATDGFVLHEQPILRLADGQVDRAELLIRMIGAGGEAIPPAAFLPVAERYDHIRDIDRWVVSHAVALLALRQAQGSAIGASINLSGPSIGDASVVDFILAEIANAGVDPSSLMFEVTETTAIGNLDRARVLAQQLSELGCDFALDDFGAGFGSFAYLKHLPLDVIKIDGEFIRSLTRSTQDQVTVRAIVDIAKGLGKQTVAEFVEDAATLELLRRLGVDAAQGYHIGRPRPALAVPDF